MSWPCRPSSTGTLGSGVIPPGPYSCRASACTVVALDSRTWGTALAPSGDFLVRTSFWLWNGLAVWLAVCSTRSIELSLVSWSRLYIVPTCQLVASPMLFSWACLRASPLWLADWPSPWQFLLLPPPPGGMVGSICFYRRGPHDETRLAAWGRWRLSPVCPVSCCF